MTAILITLLAIGWGVIFFAEVAEWIEQHLK